MMRAHDRSFSSADHANGDRRRQIGDARGQRVTTIPWRDDTRATIASQIAGANAFVVDRSACRARVHEQFRCLGAAALRQVRVRFCCAHAAPLTI